MAEKKQPLSKWSIVSFGGLASVLMMAIPLNNSIPAYIAAFIVGTIHVAIVDFIWSGFLRRWKETRRLRIACAVVVGGFVGSHFMLTKGTAFNRAFGIDTPEFAREVAVEGHYSRGLPGGISDLVIFLQFSVDRAGLQQILSKRGFERYDGKEQFWSNFGNPWVSEEELIRSREGGWRSLFGGFEGFRGTKWRDVAIPTSVEIYKWGVPANHYTVLLWDVNTGRTYVLYTFG